LQNLAEVAAKVAGMVFGAKLSQPYHLRGVPRRIPFIFVFVLTNRSGILL
jgi:hypothetical protein